MRRRLRPLFRVGLSAFLLLLLVGLAMPFLGAGRLRHRVQVALESALHRRVEFRDIHLFLFRGPGVRVDEVAIYDQAEFGIEPLAYVPSLEARVSLLSLWRDELDFGTLRLIEPSINLTQNDAGVWNIAALMGSAASATRSARPLPDIQVRGGRINFKVAGRKSPFYFGDADLDLGLPDSAGQPMSLKYSGQPGWTGQGARGLGLFSGSGRITNIQREPHLELDVQLEKGYLADALTMLAGQSFGVQGLAGVRAHIAGKLPELGVTGQLQLENVNSFPSLALISGPQSAGFSGTIHLDSQQLLLQTAEPSNSPLPLVIQLEAQSLFQQPRWTTSVRVQNLAIASILPVLRQVGLNFPEQLRLQGMLTGTLGYASPGGLEGTLRVADAVWQTVGAPAVSAVSCDLAIRNGTAEVPPCPLNIGKDRTAQIQLRYQPSNQRWEAQVASQEWPVHDFLVQTGPLFPLPPTLFNETEEGFWGGRLGYVLEADLAPDWTGNITLQQAAIDLPGFADPLRIRSADFEIDGPKLSVTHLRAGMGKLAVDGDYAYVPGLPRPHTFRLSVVAPDLAAVESEMLPTLQRSRGGLLARTLRLNRTAMPEWLADRHAEGTVRLRWKSTVPTTRPDAIQARVQWDGPQVRITNAAGQWQGASVNGQADADLLDTQPRYALKGSLKQLAWSGGTMDAEGTFKSAGVGGELLTNLESNGTFTGHSIVAGTEFPIRTASGVYYFSMRNGVPGLRLEALQISMGPETYTGHGDTEALNKLQLDLVSGNRPVRFTGSLLPLQLEVASQ